MQSPLTIVALTALLAGTPQEPAPTAAAEPAASVLDRIAFIGASLSAGAGNAAELELGKDAKLGVFVAATLADGRAEGRTVDLGDAWFFSDPRKKGAKQIDAALAAEPTSIVAPDFLFWYAFGNGGPQDRRRMAGLREGLAQLERIEVPLLVGDLPDITHALEGEGPLGGPLVTRSMFPTDDERAAMNRAIRAWAAERERVAVLPVSEMMEAMRSGDEIVVGQSRWKPESLDEVLQKDLLHPNVRGTVWAAMFVARALSTLDDVTADDFVWDERRIRERVVAATAEARAKNAERLRKRAERWKAREARRREKEGSGSGG